DLKANTPPLRKLAAATVYPPNTPVHLVPGTLPTKCQTVISIFVLNQLFDDFDKTYKKKSIQNGPTPHPMVTDPPPTGSTIVPALRKKLDSEFNDEENMLEMADTQVEIILSQGLPQHIFNILNQTSTTQEIWNNVELLMQGSGRTLQQRKENLFDEYERFCAIG
ncbi:hypothetical protein Tco_0380585, partial [Tanacetum coccineum]